VAQGISKRQPRGAPPLLAGKNLDPTLTGSGNYPGCARILESVIRTRSGSASENTGSVPVTHSGSAGGSAILYRSLYGSPKSGYVDPDGQAYFCFFIKGYDGALRQLHMASRTGRTSPRIRGDGGPGRRRPGVARRRRHVALPRDCGGGRPAPECPNCGHSGAGPCPNPRNNTASSSLQAAHLAERFPKSFPSIGTPWELIATAQCVAHHFPLWP